MAEESEGGADPEERARMLALLDEQHTFPGDFGFRVVIRPGQRTTVVQAVAALLGDDAITEVHERSSRKGNFVALRLNTVLDRSEQVLEVYEVLQRVDGVITVL